VVKLSKIFEDEIPQLNILIERANFFKQKKTVSLNDVINIVLTKDDWKKFMKNEMVEYIYDKLSMKFYSKKYEKMLLYVKDKTIKELTDAINFKIVGSAIRTKITKHFGDTFKRFQSNKEIIVDQKYFRKGTLSHGEFHNDLEKIYCSSMFCCAGPLSIELKHQNCDTKLLLKSGVGITKGSLYTLDHAFPVSYCQKLYIDYVYPGKKSLLDIEKKMWMLLIKHLLFSTNIRELESSSTLWQPNVYVRCTEKNHDKSGKHDEIWGDKKYNFK